CPAGDERAPGQARDPYPPLRHAAVKSLVTASTWAIDAGFANAPVGATSLSSRRFSVVAWRASTVWMASAAARISRPAIRGRCPSPSRKFTMATSLARVLWLPADVAAAFFLPPPHAAIAVESAAAAAAPAVLRKRLREAGWSLMARLYPRAAGYAL